MEQTSIQQAIEQVQWALRERAKRLREQATGLTSDMEALIDRLEKDRLNAKVHDIRVASFHVASTEMRLLRRVLVMLESIVNGDLERIDQTMEPEDVDEEDPTDVG